jgi:2-polyprenyl-6-methoxyphenol hydroxylase-like FAD-dependent oxidoreductase
MVDRVKRVLIAGAGPVGVVTGLYLARNGLDVTLFDMAPRPAEDHRAATLQPSTLDLFEELGLTERILEQGFKSRFFQWRDRVKDEIVAEFDYGRLSDISGHPYVIQLEQHKTVYTVLEAASRCPNFVLHRPVEVIDVRQGADWVECDVRDQSGDVATHRGDYLVGCDGGRSVVRKTAGVSFEGFTWPERFNIVSTPVDLGKIHGFRLRNYCSHPDRWVSLMQVPGEDQKGLWRCVFPAKPEESDEEVMSDAWIDARFRECMNAGPYPIVHRNMYNVHQRVAGSFRSGRIALAGDSAHVNNPIGGMGMNSGFQDGITLARKLLDIAKGGDADALLDRYDRQRRLTAIEYVQAQSIANKRLLEEKEPAIRSERLNELRKINADPARHLDFVKRASLISMWEKSEEIV